MSEKKLAGLSQPELAVFSYRELQKIAKSLYLPRNFKKQYLVEMINAKYNGTAEQVNAIIDRARRNRCPRKKRKLQASEISSCSDLTNFKTFRESTPKKHLVNIKIPNPVKSTYSLRSTDPNYSILRQTTTKSFNVKPCTKIIKSRVFPIYRKIEKKTRHYAIHNNGVLLQMQDCASLQIAQDLPQDLTVKLLPSNNKEIIQEEPLNYTKQKPVHPLNLSTKDNIIKTTYKFKEIGKKYITCITTYTKNSDNNALHVNSTRDQNNNQNVNVEGIRVITQNDLMIQTNVQDIVNIQNGIDNRTFIDYHENQTLNNQRINLDLNAQWANQIAPNDIDTNQTVGQLYPNADGNNMNQYYFDQNMNYSQNSAQVFEQNNNFNDIQILKQINSNESEHHNTNETLLSFYTKQNHVSASDMNEFKNSEKGQYHNNKQPTLKAYDKVTVYNHAVENDKKNNEIIKYYNDKIAVSSEIANKYTTVYTRNKCNTKNALENVQDSSNNQNAQYFSQIKINKKKTSIGNPKNAVNVNMHNGNATTYIQKDKARDRKVYSSNLPEYDATTTFSHENTEEVSRLLCKENNINKTYNGNETFFVNSTDYSTDNYGTFSNERKEETISYENAVDVMNGIPAVYEMQASYGNKSSNIYEINKGTNGTQSNYGNDKQFYGAQAHYENDTVYGPQSTYAKEPETSYENQTLVLPHFSELLSSDISQPIYVHVSDANYNTNNQNPQTIQWPYVNNDVSHRSHTLESLYNYKLDCIRTFPLLTKATSTNLTYCYNSPLCVSMLQTSRMAVSCPNINLINASKDELRLSESDYWKDLGVQQNTRYSTDSLDQLASQVEDINSSDSDLNSAQSVGAIVTVPDFDDTIDLLGEQNRLEMTNTPTFEYQSMECMFCPWYGPVIILGRHIRQEHSCEIRNYNSLEWQVPITLSALFNRRHFFPTIIDNMGTLYALSIKYEQPDLVLVDLSLLPSDTEHQNTKFCKLTLYNKRTGEPFSSEGRLKVITPFVFRNPDEHLHVKLCQMDVLPNSCNVVLENGDLVLKSQNKVVFGHPDFDDLSIVVNISVWDI